MTIFFWVWCLHLATEIFCWVLYWQDFKQNWRLLNIQYFESNSNVIQKTDATCKIFSWKNRCRIFFKEGSWNETKINNCENNYGNIMGWHGFANVIRFLEISADESWDSCYTSLMQWIRDFKMYVARDFANIRWELDQVFQSWL